MFQWQITLSDKQVIMLTAFHMAKPDEDGSIFHSANSMIGDAWDVRAVRKLEEQHLITVTKSEKTTIWQMTQKGQLIASAIICDADNLRRLKLHRGDQARHLIWDDSHRRWVAKQKQKRKV